MGVEDIQVEGLAPGSVEKVKYDINPNSQSELREIGDNVLITRPLSEEYTGVTNKQETLRRKEAVQLHQKEVPEYIFHKGHVILQGYKEIDGEKESVSVLGRLLDKMTNVKNITELPVEDVLSDVELCKALTTINAFQLKKLVLDSVFVDPGITGDFGNELPRGIRKIAKQLTSDNVFVGNDKKGERKIFCDPDWYVDVPNTADGIKKKVLFGSRLVARTTFFYGATKLQQIKESFKPEEKVGIKIQRKRTVEKARS